MITGRHVAQLRHIIPIIPPFRFINFCRGYETLTFTCIFNIFVLCEYNWSEVVGPIAIIYDTMIGHVVLSTVLFGGVFYTNTCTQSME
jgi:hypothetical protein